jgi:proteasome accessory factor B
MQKGKPTKKYSQAGRVHDIIRLIESRHGITLDDLAQETGVTRRTIHRDLIAIQEAGYPLISDWSGTNKLYRFITRFKDVPPISFSLQELMTLSFLRSQLDMLQGTPFHQDMASLFGKVNSALPPRFAAHMERMARVSLPLLQGKRDYSRNTATMEKLREALIFQYCTDISYQVPGKPATNYQVDPYSLLFYKGGLYLLGYAHNRKGLRTFAVERIRSVAVEKRRFEIPAEFSPEEELQGAFGIVREEVIEVKIRFAREIAHGITDRIWHQSQQLVLEQDGSVLLTFTAGGRMEIISWVLSYGRYAELLAPPDLRDELGKVAATMATLYQK